MSESVEYMALGSATFGWELGSSSCLLYPLRNFSTFGTLNFLKNGVVQPRFLVGTAAQDTTYDGPGTKFNIGAVTTLQFLLLLGILISVRFPGCLRIYLSLVHNITHPGYPRLMGRLRSLTLPNG